MLQLGLTAGLKYLLCLHDTIVLHMHVPGQFPDLRGPRTAWSVLLTSFREEVHLHRGSGGAKAAVLDKRNGWLLFRNNRNNHTGVPRAVKAGRRLDRAVETCSKYHLGIKHVMATCEESYGFLPCSNSLGGTIATMVI